MIDLARAVEAKRYVFGSITFSRREDIITSPLKGELLNAEALIL